MNIPRVNAPERLKYAIRKIEDIQSSEAAALRGATALSTVPSELQSLQKMLWQIRHVLMNSQANWEESQSTDPSVKNCLNELEAVGIHTENVIINFLDDLDIEVRPGNLPDNLKNKNQKFVNFFALHRLKVDIQNIKSQVQRINIKDLSAPSDRAITRPAEQSLFNVDDILLPDNETHRKCILQRLVDQSLQTRSVVLVGNKIFTKTVLAEKIYQSTEVKTHFEACFWLFPQILQDPWNVFKSFRKPSYLFKPIDILIKMLFKLGNTYLSDAHDEDFIMSGLRQFLSRKRCLVVVDNNWKELWTLVNAAFPDGNNGSRLLITGEMKGQISDYKYELPFLNDEDSLKLQKEFWEENDLVFHTQLKESLLNQSYLKLSSVLKTCIVYTAAVFPCNSVVLADSLIRLWIIEGIIPHEEGTTMEIIAESYLEQLVERGLLHNFGAYYHNQADRLIRSIILHPRLHLIIKLTVHNHVNTQHVEEDKLNELLPVTVILSVDAFDKYIGLGEYIGTGRYYWGAPSDNSTKENLKNLRGLALHLPYQFNQISSFEKGPQPKDENEDRDGDWEDEDVNEEEDDEDKDEDVDEEEEEDEAENEDEDEDEEEEEDDDDDDEEDDEFVEGFSTKRNLKNSHVLALHKPYKFNQIFSSFEEGPNQQRFHHPSLHSLFFFHYVAPIASPQFIFIRVLAVFSSHLRFPEEYAPCWLDELINLRYLGFIVCLVEGGSLGNTLDRLVKLEILDLSESFVSGLSEFIKNNTKVNVVGPFKEELPEIWSPIPDMFQ